MNLERKLELSRSKAAVNVVVTPFATVPVDEQWLKELQKDAKEHDRSENWFDRRTRIHKTIYKDACDRAERVFLAGE